MGRGRSSFFVMNIIRLLCAAGTRALVVGPNPPAIFHTALVTEISTAESHEHPSAGALLTVSERL